MRQRRHSRRGVLGAGWRGRVSSSWVLPILLLAQQLLAWAGQAAGAPCCEGGRRSATAFSSGPLGLPRRRRAGARRAEPLGEEGPRVAGEGGAAEGEVPLLVQLGVASLDDWRAGRRALRTTVWENRRAVARFGVGCAEQLAKLRAQLSLEELQTEEERKLSREAQKEEQTNQLATLAFVAAASAVLIRVAGRSAVLNLLGLDALQDPEVKDALEGVLSTADSMDPALKFLFVLLAWAVAKVFLLDFVTFPLAVADGVLFGGVLQGTLVSCICATLGSSIAFFLSRTLLFEKTRTRMDTSPGLRAVENAVAGEGAKAVFTLRLAPVLPLPIGGYAYIYGITRLQWQDFALGTFVGSAKPYFLDAYLGTFIKEGVVQPDAGGGALADAVLFLTLVATVATGTFASELAVRSFSELNTEIEAFDKERARSLSKGGRLADPVLSNQSFLDAMAFWGLRSGDFPGPVAGGMEALEQAQLDMRSVYAEHWASAQRESGTKAPDEQPTAAAAAGQERFCLRPEVAEAESDWAFRWAPESLQALLTLPVFLEALGAYSKPALWPQVLKAAQDKVAAQQVSKFTWLRSVVHAKRSFGRWAETVA